MAANLRPMMDELREGMADGAVKRFRPNTSNIVLDESNPARDLLSKVEGGYDLGSSDPATAKRMIERYTRGLARE